MAPGQRHDVQEGQDRVRGEDQVGRCAVSGVQGIRDCAVWALLVMVAGHSAMALVFLG
jgi:hypothetical protein